jgi:GH15 family glucan-1,4-alpha-glucosidase
VASRIEDYALIGDTRTAALVARDGSLDWLCVPRFDSPACFAALLGAPEHGRWLLGPAAEAREIRRHYRRATLVLETVYETTDGSVTVTDCMPIGDDRVDVVRLVSGRRGRVAMEMEIVIRFDYGSVVPWVHQIDGGLAAIAGPDALELRTPVQLRAENFRTRAEFEVAEGESVPFTLTWHPSHLEPPPPTDAREVIGTTEHWWREWSGRGNFHGEFGDAVHRSLITLKALTYAPTGGIVAAPTTSLPERLGGVRNWDYRYCWLRDATFTLYALLTTGYHEEAKAWREWLVRAAAGRPEDLQIMYGVAGERRLTEMTLDWLPGYQDSSPVRVGNAAYRQFQLDVYGEVMDMMHVTRRSGVEVDEAAWHVQRVLLDFLESGWDKPDEGIWEVRGGPRHFTYSKVMAWVGFDRAVKAVERFRAEGPVDRWRRLRDRIHAEVCDKAFDRDRGAFVQSYGSRNLDASLLLIPHVGFLRASDPRVKGTVDAIERELMIDGLVRRYAEADDADSLPPGEGAFLACSFWLADNLALQGRRSEARRVFKRLLSLRNDVGLLAEEYDPEAERQVGNFPQALSHIALVNTAWNLTETEGPMHHRARQ